MAYKQTYNPCDDCQYSYSKNNQESNMCKVCEFRQLLDKPTADVVPKSEVDNWYQLYHSIKEELKQEKMYHRETDKLCDRYYIESQHAKRQVAREIFEEIEKAHDECIGVDITTRIGYFQQTKFEHKLAELKKKYTEGEDDRRNY